MKRLASLIFVLTLVLTGCAPDWMNQYLLTADAHDRYDVTGTQDVELVVTAPSDNVGGNLRTAMINADTPESGDQTSCATWLSWHDGSQPGAVLRWTGTTGVTVTKNVWGGAYWTLNVHTWDIKNAQPFTLVKQFEFAELVHAPWPWRLCASARGQQVTFTLDTTAYDASGSVTVHAMPEVGRPGWYAGHIAPGNSIVLNDLVSTP